MRYKFITPLLLTATFFLIAICQVPYAQENSIIIENKDIFGSLKRMPVEFPHDLHMEAYAEESCGVCHHTYDNNTSKLVYEDGMELACKECHEIKKIDNTPALREAYHGSCTVCHRNLIKNKITPSGPTTCGECHKK